MACNDTLKMSHIIKNTHLYHKHSHRNFVYLSFTQPVVSSYTSCCMSHDEECIICVSQGNVMVILFTQSMPCLALSGRLAFHPLHQTPSSIVLRFLLSCGLQHLLLMQGGIITHHIFFISSPSVSPCDLHLVCSIPLCAPGFFPRCGLSGFKHLPTGLSYHCSIVNTEPLIRGK